MSRPATAETLARTHGQQPSRTRWLIVTLLFVLYTVNCVDRSSVSVGLPHIAKDLALSGTVQGLVMSAFFWSYSLLQIPGGWATDKLGPRRVIGVAGVLWGVFQAVAGFAVNGVMLILTRIGLGAFEAPFMPRPAG
ncbi:MFS transporter [Nocardia sp. CA2R105]|nr:MFS transporter [Nocardia coffeae]MBY8858537.1 MFS transporter [Nocardia coffeae]